MEYRHKEIDAKWKSHWRKKEIYKITDTSILPKYYVLDMFPYPSGAGLHVGHPLGYIASDIISRSMRMKGYHVLHPMGFDAFGLPAEQYAMQKGIHPAISTQENIERYRSQLENIGLSYDWSREVITSDPKFYKWTQWIFLKLYHHYYNTKEQKAKPILELVELFQAYGNAEIPATNNEDQLFTAVEWANFSAKEKDNVLMNYRLAYRKQAFVNWCEALGTVLANDEIKDGLSERGGHPVEKKPMMQWALRITAYAERLLNELEGLAWSDPLKIMQRNWIGKSTGAQIFFKIKDFNQVIEVFTTRPDTIFGASFIVLAPEHPLLKNIISIAHQPSVSAYLELVKNRSELERQSDSKSVTGVFTGSYVTHPFTNQSMQIWISEYILIDYGTGAIMAVPGNDLRDQAFAKKFNLPIIEVVDQSEYPNSTIEDKVGKMIHSDFLNGLDVIAAISKIIEELQRKKLGHARVQYKMRDANFSRQRYWGEPFPIIYDTKGVSYALSDESLPLILPEIQNIKPGEGGKSPISNIDEWVILPDGFTRETDTMPGYAGSSWYFLRYMNPHNEDDFASNSALNYWRDVDLYIGGTEHAVGHLMYSRFWHKFLFDLGLVPTTEPFKKLVNQGMIQGIIESLLVLKDSHPVRIISADISNQFSAQDLSQIPVHIDFVVDYGTVHSHMTQQSLISFVTWKGDFQKAIFENNSGAYTFDNMPIDFTIKTKSEIGKMSKRYHNVVNPDDVVALYGADCFRMYEMFLGPLEQSKPWDTKGISGVAGFLRKYFDQFWNDENNFELTIESANSEELKILHTCIKKVNSDLEQLSFNTSVSAFMICVNELRRLNCRKKEILWPLTKLLAPFAPFITEEIWSLAGEKDSIHYAPYPIHDEQYLQSDEVIYPVSVNGKKRHEWQVPKSWTQDQLEREVLQLEEIKKWTDNHPIKKIIIVPSRMINIVL
ncbi:MAG: leucine--tRNA ligase [Bacteroidota bacterium]|nr:leucine--tRNA ligase [Bacteroidota bacterium]